MCIRTLRTILYFPIKILDGSWVVRSNTIWSEADQRCLIVEPLSCTTQLIAHRASDVFKLADDVDAIKNRKFQTRATCVSSFDEFFWTTG